MADYSMPTLAQLRAATIPRPILQQNAEAIITQNYPREVNVSATIGIGGTVYLMAVGALAGDVITNISIGISTAGAAMTASLVGIYDTAGNRVATSADQGTNWQSAGLKTIALTAPYVVPTTGALYAALVATGGTIPVFARGAALGPALILAAAVGSGVIPFASLAGQTGLPSSLTIAAGAAPIAYWIALS